MGNHKRILKLVSKLGEWELLPLIYQAKRIEEGQRKYGKGRKFINWEREMAEEATDFLNYYVWREYELQSRKRHKKRKG